MNYHNCTIVLNAYYAYCIFGEDMFYHAERLIKYLSDNNIRATVQDTKGIVRFVTIMC